MVRNKVWSIWWVQIWSTLIYCHREFEYMQSCKWEPIAGQNQVLILPFFSVLLLYHFTIVIISDKKILYSFIKEICSQPFSSFVLLWVLNMWLVVTELDLWINFMLIYYQSCINPLTPWSDSHLTSPYNFPPLSSKQALEYSNVLGRSYLLDLTQNSCNIQLTWKCVVARG